MNRKLEIAMMALALAPVAAQGEVLDGGWRLSAGAVYDSGVKTSMKFMPQQTYVSPYSLPKGTQSEKSAFNKASGKADGSRTEYVNPAGDTAWVDSNDPAVARDDDVGKTQYYQLPVSGFAGCNDDGSCTFTLSHEEWGEVDLEETPFDLQEQHDYDEHAMPGVSVQVSRNLYHDDDNNWGLEVALGVQYARNQSALRSKGSWSIGRSRKRTGTYEASYTDRGMLADLFNLYGSDYVKDTFSVKAENERGEYVDVYGQQAKGEMGATAPIDLADGLDNPEWGKGERQSTDWDEDFGALYAKGDYDNLEMMLLLQPYYDVCEWFSVNATIGAVCSRQSMDMSFALFRNGEKEYSRERDYSQWDVYGVAGLGAMFYYEGWTLSGDVMARFFDRDLTINDKYYKGTVSRGNWMFRVGLGYEF